MYLSLTDALSGRQPHVPGALCFLWPGNSPRQPRPFLPLLGSGSRLPRACRLRSHPATDYLQGDGPLSLSVALPDRLTQITYAIRVRALLVSHRTCRVLTHSGFFRALSVTAAVFRGSPSLFGVIAGACIAVSLLRSCAACVLRR